MTLSYLDFDYSEDDQGISTWDAMASVTTQRLPALLAEIALVLNWAQQQFCGQRGLLDEDGLWDYDLQSQPEGGAPALHLHYDEDAGQITLAQPPEPQARYTLTLTLSGSAAFAQALRARFGLDAE
ncbi:MAG: hypothetical protein K2Y10_05175 [Burkholderiaceae bacterium]|nr:hypothetical protein [Burkholderiaceae bacterium]